MLMTSTALEQPVVPVLLDAIRLRGPGGLHQNSLEIDFIVVSDRGE